MRTLKKAGITLGLLLSLIQTISAQKQFQGSFLMTFVTAEPEKDHPLLWSIKADSTGGKMAMQVQDEMLIKGVNKRVVFIPADSAWTMLISFNKVKQGTRIHGAAMYRDTVKHRPFKTLVTKENKMIDGYDCKKITINSDKYSADVWVTDAIKFDLCKIYRLASHCGMMGEFVGKGDWFRNKKIKSMVLEVDAKDLTTGNSYIMRISQIINSFDPEMFTIDGFKIADIPEGQNCGTMEN